MTLVTDLSFSTGLRALTTLGLSLALAGPLPGLAQTSGPAVAQTPTLIMGTEADYSPFEFRDASDPPSDIVGFDIEVAKALSQRLGFELRIQESRFEALLPALQRGELDFAIAAITPTDERRQVVDFSDPYFESRHALVSRRSNPIRTLDDLPGSRVAVQRGSIQEVAARRLVDEGLDIEMQSFNTVSDMITAVRDQTVDAAMIEELVAAAYLETNPTLDLDVLGEIAPTPVAIAFPKGSPRVEAFNQALAEMRASGELDELARLWFSAAH